ncbi:MAG: hypothetical protein NTV61_09010 [Candidatus Bathyarchaeota archaeon]|nr:hypothetical protein [Candidatus Bathyarchaeota archaeon]
MAQDVIDIREEPTMLDSPLVVCKGCGKVVPKTNLCLYCGAPILYRRSAPT